MIDLIPVHGDSHINQSILSLSTSLGPTDCNVRHDGRSSQTSFLALVLLGVLLDSQAVLQLVSQCLSAVFGSRIRKVPLLLAFLAVLPQVLLAFTEGQTLFVQLGLELSDQPNSPRIIPNHSLAQWFPRRLVPTDDRLSLIGNSNTLDIARRKAEEFELFNGLRDTFVHRVDEVVWFVYLPTAGDMEVFCWSSARASLARLQQTLKLTQDEDNTAETPSDVHR